MDADTPETTLARAAVETVIFTLHLFKGKPLPVKITDFLFDNWCEFCGDPQTGDARRRCQCWNDE